MGLTSVVAQAPCTGNCNTGTSNCYVDTLASPSATINLFIEGNGMCCTGFQKGGSTNYNCAQMFITVPPGTEGLTFAYNGPNQCAIDVHDLTNGCPANRNNGTSVCDPFCPTAVTYCEGESNAENVTFEFTLCKEGNFNLISLDITGVPKACLEVENTVEDCDVTFVVSEGAVWTANPPTALNYLSCLNCTHPTFSYTDAPITDCNGLNLEYTATTTATDCESAQSITKTMTVYPTLDGTISAVCADECRSVLTYTPLIDCPQLVFTLVNSLGDTIASNSTGDFTVDSDNTTYEIIASRPEVSECHNSEYYTPGPEMIAPTFSYFPPDISIYLDSLPDPDTITVTTGFPAAADNCDLAPSIAYYDNLAGLTACSATGDIIRTFTATDDCGNTATMDQIISILDTLSPVITQCPPDIDSITGCDTLDLGTIGGLPYSTVEAYIDSLQFAGVGGSYSEANSVLIYYIDEIVDNTCPNPIINVTRTFTVLDACGNFDTCIQSLEFVDTTNPEITCPPPLLSVDGCDENDVTAASTGLDYASSSTSVSNAQFTALGGYINDVCGLLSIQYYDSIVPDMCPQAMLIVTRTFIVTDQCANTQSCQQDIEVYDLSGPEFLSHPDTTVNCTDVPPYSEPSVMDDCTAVFQVSFQEDTLNQVCINEFDIRRSWVYEDQCGNQSSHVQWINVIDTIPPDLTCPADLTINYDNTCVVDTTLGFTGSPILSNSCSGSFSWTYSDDTTGINTYNGHGTISRTFTASDICGNQASCQQNITLGGHFCGDGCAKIHTNGFLMYRNPYRED